MAIAQWLNNHLIFPSLIVRVLPMLLLLGDIMVVKTESTLTYLVSSSSAKAEHSPCHPKVKGSSPSTAAGVRIYND
jgi:hypothetical protein